MVQKDYSNKANITRGAAKNSLLFHILKWLLIIAIVLLAVGLITKPIRKNWSSDYLARGNTYLDQKKYLSAELEYQKALYLYSDNTEAQKNLDLAQKAEIDVSVLESYYQKRNLDSQLELFIKAKKIPATPAEAVKISKELIEANEYQLAIIPAKTATEMDSSYEDGWKYFGIAALYSSQKVEISATAKAKYSDEVTTAKSHLREIPEILK
ncbi:MAG: hypothetical protein Q7S80_01800 [bacterium]|nr:hypothetical protein [bacterium]